VLPALRAPPREAQQFAFLQVQQIFFIVIAWMSLMSPDRRINLAERNKIEPLCGFQLITSENATCGQARHTQADSERTQHSPRR
jgi:hypothetical protein